MSKRNDAKLRNRADENFAQGLVLVRDHPLFWSLLSGASFARISNSLCPTDGWALVSDQGCIHIHPARIAEPAEWQYVVAHCLLHLAFGHLAGHDNPLAWNAACDMFVAKFLADLKFGRAPEDVEYRVPAEFYAQTEERLYQRFCLEGVPSDARSFSLSGKLPYDMIADPNPPVPDRQRTDWQDLFGRGLSSAVNSAVAVAAGVQESLSNDEKKRSPAQLARSWFVSSYPLLGALAASFKIIEDAPVCIRMGISVAAVDAQAREIYVNPNANLSDDEARFVIAHELLHVGLSHHTRAQGRDPFFWNVACDYVINGWLVEMRVGSLPRLGALYDPELKGESAEAIYDRIVIDIRHYRKVATLRGIGLGDILPERLPDWWKTIDGISLDDFYRRCLAQGFDFHMAGGRGFLPAGLIEEIRALSMPPVPWDVQLAKWFDNHFAPLEKVRSYARLSRRQSSTPDIPRPRWIQPPETEQGRTFGVILDTSGSMERTILAKALGTIASYSIAHDVVAVRVVFCDAMAYDQGYMSPEAIAEELKIKGRGGTILQPAIDLLERAEDFPKDGPMLIITDGYCDRLRIWRDHAFVLPDGRNLPFAPRGLVFKIS